MSNLQARVPCTDCGRPTHRPDPKTGRCRTCIVATRPTAACQRCGHLRPIFNQEAGLCHRCDTYIRLRPNREAMQIKRPCSVCGEIRSSAIQSRHICLRCYLQEKNGRGICVVCGKEKPIFNKKQQQCKRCYEKRRAPDDFRRYVERYTTPYHYNKTLFDLFVLAIDQQTVTCLTVRQVHAFGRFLQHHHFEEPLTWEAINAARPPLQSGSRSTALLIRGGLFTIGNLLASQGKLERREVYIARRCWQYPIAQAPEPLQEMLRCHTEWLQREQRSAQTIYNNLQLLSAFWRWCWQRGVRTPEDVDEGLVQAYFLTLHRQWRCRACHALVEFDPAHPEPPATCPMCQVEGTLARERRYARSMTCNYRGALRRFFYWAVVNKLTRSNPVTVKSPKRLATIRHYAPSVIEQLCVYIMSPEAEPAEALALYLIIFHAFSTWELNHVQLPADETNSNGERRSLADHYHVVLPRRPATIGDHSPGRPPGRVDFHSSVTTWLTPLLERFERQRMQAVRNPSNRYLFVSEERTKHDVAANAYPRFLVQRATRRVLGAVCQPNILRKTVAVMLADRADGSILEQLGWDGQQAYQYTLSIRQEVSPMPEGDT